MVLTFRLVKIENGVYYFDYFPEGDERYPGRIAKTKDGPVEIIKVSERDEFRFYLPHALWGIDVEKTSGTVAWY